MARWGIIGPGKIATEFIHDLPLAGSEETVSAVLGRRMDSADEFADQYGIKGRYISLGEFIEKGRPEIVYIATPHPLHYEEAKFCLQHKIPVLCEKPLCINSEQCRDLVNEARRTGTFLMEGMWIRFLPPVCKVLDLIQEKQLGELQTIFASMNFKAPEEPGSRYFNPDLGGGSLLDLGVYSVFLSVLLLGKPATIKAVATLTDKNIDKICSAVFSHNGGEHSIIESSLVKNADHPAVINGSLGTVKIQHPWFERSPGIDFHPDNGQKLFLPLNWEGHGLHFEIGEVLRCIANGKIESEKMPHQLSIDLAEVMDEIRSQCGIEYRKFE